ncbi:MAG: MurT ligase domain-containing protein, partial [bacterium]
VRPRVVVLLNLSRDQLSRSHEVTRVVRAWSETLAASDATVVANCADPNVVAAVPEERAVWFDPGLRWTEDALTCPRCGGLVLWSDGAWSCSCGLAMPRPRYRREGSSVVGPDGVRRDVRLCLPGDFNVGNAVAALAAAEAMGVDGSVALDRMSSVQSAFGRYLRYDIGGRPTRLVLAKNPVGMRAALDLVGDAPVVIGISADDVDGRDTSWLYDAPFEDLAGRVVGATGKRRDDLALRLHIAGAQPMVDADVHRLAARMPQGDLVLVGNYSNFILWRREHAWGA